MRAIEKTPEQHKQEKTQAEENLIEYQIVSADVTRALGVIAARQINKEDDWTKQALCSAGVDPEIFDTTGVDSKAREKALRYCDACSVSEDCLDTALDNKPNPIADLIWGGKTPEERKEINRRRNILRRRNRR